jgi:hypothetical protein
MKIARPKLPLDRQQVLDGYFVESRSKLVDVAAFLDRVDRAGGKADFRLDAFRAAARILLEKKPGRARRVLLAFSDPTTAPIPKATTKAACGASPAKARKSRE